MKNITQDSTSGKYKTEIQHEIPHAQIITQKYNMKIQHGIPHAEKYNTKNTTHHFCFLFLCFFTTRSYTTGISSNTFIQHTDTTRKSKLFKKRKNVKERQFRTT